MMKSDPFVQCSQYLHQLQYDANVNTVLTEDKDDPARFDNSISSVLQPPRTIMWSVVSVRAFLMFRRRSLSLLYLCMCVFRIYNMDVLAFSLSPSGATDSTSHTIRVRAASSSSSKPRSWRRNGWSSLAWHCECFVVSVGLHFTVLFFRSWQQTQSVI